LIESDRKVCERMVQFAIDVFEFAKARSEEERHLGGERDNWSRSPEQQRPIKTIEWIEWCARLFEAILIFMYCVLRRLVYSERQRQPRLKVQPI
jgi:hypothetical protein